MSDDTPSLAQVRAHLSVFTAPLFGQLFRSYRPVLHRITPDGNARCRRARLIRRADLDHALVPRRTESGRLCSRPGCHPALPSPGLREVDDEGA